MAEHDFSIYEIINRKKQGKELTREEITWTVQSFMTKKVQDYHMSALLMAIFLKGMTTKETAYLTDAMLYSGKTLKFDETNIVDKHSTGGVGDKTSFILAPIAAACGVRVPMIAGRGLGHTGGTVDKIESIPGYKTTQTLNRFSKLLLKNNLVLIGQTDEIAPADKIIYALRDVTATIDSIPLITASIMSKKLAEGANGIVMDIKVGNGAFMKNKADARALARSILQTAKRFKKKSVCVLSNMDQPLGNAIGNSNEIIESIETLKGNGPEDLTELSIALSAHMIVLAGVEKNYTKAKAMALKTIEDGTALKKFKEMLKAQGGDTKVVDDYSLLPTANTSTIITSPRTAYIKSFDTELLGLLLTDLGGGRKTKEDKIDFGVGFYFHNKIGDRVKKGDPIFTITHHKRQSTIVSNIEKRFFNEVIKFQAAKVEKPKTIIEVQKL